MNATTFPCLMISRDGEDIVWMTSMNRAGTALGVRVGGTNMRIPVLHFSGTWAINDCFVPYTGPDITITIKQTITHRIESTTGEPHA